MGALGGRRLPMSQVTVLVTLKNLKADNGKIINYIETPKLRIPEFQNEFDT